MIFAFYREQKSQLEKLFEEQSNCDELLRIISIKTPDQQQGDEFEIVIIGGICSRGNISFLGSLQRLNIALTRAKHILILLLDCNTFDNQAHWGELVEDAKKRQFFLKINGNSTIKNIWNKRAKSLKK